jgi:hypothetical protein
MTTLSQWVRQAPGIYAAHQGRTVSEAAHPLSRACICKFDKAPHPVIKEAFNIMALPILGIDIAKLKFNVCLINHNGKRM